MSDTGRNHRGIGAPQKNEASVPSARPAAYSEEDLEVIMLLDELDERQAAETRALRERQEVESLRYRQELSREDAKRIRAFHAWQKSRREKEAAVDDTQTVLSKARSAFKEQLFPEKRQTREERERELQEQHRKRDSKELHTFMIGIERREVELLFQFSAKQVERFAKEMLRMDRENARYLREHGMAHRLRKEAEAQRLREAWEKMRGRDGPDRPLAR